MEVGMSMWSAAAVLFFLMDPLGNIPVVLSVLKGFDAKKQRRIIIRELLMALVILVLFYFVGKPFLTFLNLKQEAVTISGGLILLIIGLRMIFPRRDGVMGNTPGGEPFLVPIAIPLVAGPSVLAMLILMSQSAGSRTMEWLGAVFVAWMGAALILLAAPSILKILKERGLIAMERLMGMILVMLAVQMFINGVQTVL